MSDVWFAYLPNMVMNGQQSFVWDEILPEVSNSRNFYNYQNGKCGNQNFSKFGLGRRLLCLVRSVLALTRYSTYTSPSGIGTPLRVSDMAYVRSGEDCRSPHPSVCCRRSSPERLSPSHVSQWTQGLLNWAFRRRTRCQVVLARRTSETRH